MSLLKRSSIYLGSNILNALVPFLLLPVLTHHLSTAEYGQIAMFQTLVTGLAALMGLNTIGAANRRYYDNEKEDISSYNGACIHILLATIVTIGICSYFFASKIGLLLSIPIYWVHIAITVASANFLIQFRLGQWQVREQAIKFGIMQISQSLINFLFSIILIIIYKYGADGRIYALLISTLMYASISITLLYKNNLVKLSKVRVEYIKDALSYGAPLVPHVVGIFFLSSVDRFFINRELGISAAGIYMFAVQLSLGMAVIFDAINKAIITSLFKNLSERNEHTLNRVVRNTYLFFIIVLSLGGLSFIVGPWVVQLIGGNKFVKSAEIIGWLCLGQAFGGMYLMVTNYVFYAKKTGLLSLLTITTGILNVVLLIVFLKYYGLIGVSIAFSMSMFFRFIGTWIIAMKVSDFSWRVSLFTRK